MALLFVGGMIIGNKYLPESGTVRAAAVSVPDLNTQNPIFARTTREWADRDLSVLSQALQSCPVVVSEEKDRLVNHLKLWLALEDFYVKKAVLELEMAKNVETNRPTAQYVQAAQDYNAAREQAEKLADELFPPQLQQSAELATADVSAAPSPAAN